jgi:hydrogenase/urease accessory protein HupE
MVDEEDVAMRPCLRSLVGASVIGLAGLAVGCAHAPAGPAEEKAAERVFVTGSHIARKVDSRTGIPLTTSPVRVYTRNQIDDTGRPYDMRAALRTLDPSLSQ